MTSFDLVSDESLEAALDRELIDIATSDGVSDPETLRDLVLAGNSHIARYSNRVFRAEATIASLALASALLVFGVGLIWATTYWGIARLLTQNR